MPKFNSISISGYHMQEAGANQALELAFTLADGKEYVKTAIAKGLDVDDFAGRLSFFWAIGMNFYLEVAKMRAARLLWCRIMKGFNAKNPKSLMLRTHCQTSGWSLTEQDPYNNVVRTTIEAMAAVFGGTQSLHTNALRRSHCAAHRVQRRIARNTQLIIQEETHITNVVDPWAGSYMMEKLTQDMADAAWKIIEEVEAMGGMTRPWTAAGPSSRSRPRGRKAGAHRQRQGRDRRRQQVQAGQGRRGRDPARSTTSRCATARLPACSKSRQNATAAKVQQALDALTSAAEGRGQPAGPEHPGHPPARHGGRGERCAGKGFRAPPRRHAKGDRCVRSRLRLAEGWDKLKAEINAFAEEQGRRPRVMIAKLGQDGHDRGAKVVATAFADLGFDVDMGPLFQTPEECARQAIENDVHAVGVSTLAAGHKTLVPAIIAELKAGRRRHHRVRGRRDSAQDYDFCTKPA
jgi:methylmalonyl-CoA mutase